MKPLNRLFRVVVFSGCAVWLMTQTQPVRAQLQSCNKFDSQDGNPCDTCCNGGSQEMGISDGIITGAGYQMLVPQPENCGTSAGCPGPNPNGYCGTQSWQKAVDDPADCCLPTGTPCNQGTCCGGLICLSNNKCGTCIANGQSSQSPADCCSGLRDPNSGQCVMCLNNGIGCSTNSQCCSANCYNLTCSATSCPDTASCQDHSTFATDYCMYPGGGCPTGYYSSN